ncbi:MAG: hypothetical protein LBW85_00710, partial [Deltaproteobacteria bacterium]|nr:hypothetical protein [Deltaproteobacteria bacterium]
AKTEEQRRKSKDGRAKTEEQRRKSKDGRAKLEELNGKMSNFRPDAQDYRVQASRGRAGLEGRPPTPQAERHGREQSQAEGRERKINS